MQTIDVTPTEPKNVTPMTADEARAVIEQVNAGVNSIRLSLLELHRREGWKALGYSSWKELAEQEFKQDRRNLYYLIDAAELEANLVTAGIEARKIFHTPESQLRAIAKAPVTRQADAFETLKSWEEQDGKVTEKEAEAAVAAVDPNFAYQQAEKLVSKFVAKGGNVNNVEEVFADSSPRLKQVLTEPVKELLKQAGTSLPPSQSKPTHGTSPTPQEEDETPTSITEDEATEVREYLLEFPPSDVAIVVLGLPKEYRAAIKEALA